MANISPFLNADAWSMIALHLKPRHMFKLMLVSKPINKAVDTDAYWARVALHLMWRQDILLLNGHPELRAPELSDRLGELSAMVNVQAGYYAGMEKFIKLVRLFTADGYLKRFEEYSDFHEFQDAPLCALVRLYERFTVKHHIKYLLFGKPMDPEKAYMHCDKDEKLSMKQVAQREDAICVKMRRRYVLEDWVKFMRVMEDDPMPAAHKRRFANTLQEFFSNYIVEHAEKDDEEENVGLNYLELIIHGLEPFARRWG